MLYLGTTARDDQLRLANKQQKAVVQSSSYGKLISSYMHAWLR